MNDRFKFRAWDKTQKVMIDSVAVYENGSHIGFNQETFERCYAKNIETVSHLEFDSNGWVYLLDNFEIMQCPGLKDKNGKLIWEGDILKIFDLITKESNLVKVKWFGDSNSPEFSLSPSVSPYNCNGLGNLIFGGLYHFEVIGNIYETPELFIIFSLKYP